jgi:hypothetical protein
MKDFGDDGYALVGGVLSARECALAARAAQGEGAGARGLLAQPWCAALAARLRAHPLLAGLIGPAMVAVQCTAFQKSAERNWLVPLHQDLSIPVARRVADPALSGWSLKEGIDFVRAPAHVLAQLVAVRVHLDPCGVDDGPLRVVPGSHRHGILDQQQLSALRAQRGETVCVADTGAALVLRPLLLHASSKGSGGSARRVLHFVFGPAALPHGLEWHLAL